MAGGWLEPRTRIPFAGIIAIVIIVAIVALFLRSYVVDVFPENEISIQGAVVQENANLRGSATFQGERQFELSYKERLTGMLSRTVGTLTFVVDVPARLLTVTSSGNQKEVLLQPTEDGAGLQATFEIDGERAEVAVYPGKRLLRFKEGIALDISLSDTVNYEGSFMYDGEQYPFRYSPADAAVAIGLDVVRLKESDGVLVGEWRDEVLHRVTVDTSRQVATIDNLW